MAQTFGNVAEEVAAHKAHTFKPQTGTNNDQRWLNSLRKHCDYIWNMPLGEIKRCDALNCLQGIWRDKPNQARKVRQRAKQCFAYAMADDETLLSNPFGEGIDGKLTIWGSATRTNHPARSWQDTPSLYGALSNNGSAANCLRLIILTGVRCGEATGATWAEFQGDTWVIPAARMKMGIEHRVPLSLQAQALVASMQVRSKAQRPLAIAGTGYVFPGRGGSRLHSNSVLDAVKRADATVTVHGFRATLRTWLLEQSGASWAVAEACLAHQLGDGVETRYIRTDLLDNRAPVMQAWSNYVVQ